jgi:hypothetical protein
MTRSLTLITACALALVTFAPARAQDATPSPSPSLGEIARQAQKDKDRDKANKTAAKVFTNEDFSSNPGGVSGTLGGGLGPIGQTSAAGKSADALSPAEKLAKTEILLSYIESLDRATLVHNALNGRDVEFPGRAKWEERLVAARQVYVSQGRDMIQNAKEIVASADGLKAVAAQNPNDPRVKEMGVKLQSLIREAVRTDSAFQAVMMEGRDLAAQANAHE